MVDSRTYQAALKRIDELLGEKEADRARIKELESDLEAEKIASGTINGHRIEMDKENIKLRARIETLEKALARVRGCAAQITCAPLYAASILDECALAGKEKP